MVWLHPPSHIVFVINISLFGADTLFGFFSKDFNPTPLIPIDSAHPGQIEAALKDIHEQSNAQLSKQGQLQRHQAPRSQTKIATRPATRSPFKASRGMVPEQARPVEEPEHRVGLQRPKDETGERFGGEQEVGYRSGEASERVG